MVTRGSGAWDHPQIDTHAESLEKNDRVSADFRE